MILRRRRSSASSRFCSWCGYTLLEVLFVASLLVVLIALAVPQVLEALDDFRAVGAARYVSTRLQRARMDAVTRSVDVGLRFTQGGGTYAYTVHLDGNSNGIRTRDIQRGLDPQMAPPEQLPDHFPGVDFAVLPGLPAVESGSASPGSDPIRLGTADILTFTPTGSSSSGSLYICSRRSRQFVIRVFGDTGKTRILRFDPRSREWVPL